MSSRYNEFSDEIYHRLYRMIKKKVDPHCIAATLHLPYKTVITVIARINKTEKNPDHKPRNASVKEKPVPEPGFLDAYIYSKTRFAVLQLVGTLNQQTIESLDKELDKIYAGHWKAAAVKMTDIVAIDEAASQNLLLYHRKFTEGNKFFAILDPSSNVEQILMKYNLEDFIPIFGTERAFEDAAFPRKMMGNPHP
ncbi:MAG TPA: hypothetical protein PLE24_00730 [Chitinispirillaceae bacterium]|nr:hypothetical protein [Chitinispirillaceae bacterium]